VRLVLAGLPRPRTQYVVRDGTGRQVARVDLGWEEHRLAMEYEGAWHFGSYTKVGRDLKRHNRLTAAEWTVLYVTADRLRDDFDGSWPKSGPPCAVVVPRSRAFIADR
jgi:very-short-patch-repair endonuclease